MSDDEEMEYEAGSDQGDEGDTWEFEEPEDEQGDNDEAEVENKYYNAKGEIEENPQSAYEQFKEIIEMPESEGKWKFKSLKQLVKCCYTLDKMAEMKQRYEELLAYQWSDLTRGHTEKAINKCLDLVGRAGGEVLRAMLEATLKAIGNTKGQEKLVFQVQYKLGQQAYEGKDYETVRRIVDSLSEWCKNPDGTLDEKKGTQFLTVKALEIQMYTDLDDKKALKKLYTESLNIESAIPPPKILGIINESGGKMYMRENQFDEAKDAFFHAFKNYDEAGHPRRIACLKYLVLASLLAESEIDPFDSTEAKPYKNDPEVSAMTLLVSACRDADIRTVEKVLRENRNTIAEDPIIMQFLQPLLHTVRLQVVLRITKPYTTVRIPFIAEQLNIDYDQAESLLVDVILDRKLHGQIDQVRQLLIMTAQDRQGGRTESYGRWANQITTLHSSVTSRIPQSGAF